jgi:hypothetical protein
MLSRRDLVGKLAASTAAVWVAGVARSSFASTRPQAAAPAGANTGDGRLATPQQDPVAVSESPARVVDAQPPTTLSAAPPWQLLRPLAMGSVVAQGWRVAGLTGAVDGSCVLTLQNERSRSHRVHLCRNDGRPNGLVYTKQFDLVVMNGGEGDLPTEEGFARAVAEVAHVLAANEGNREHATVVAALQPHAERVRLFSGDADRRLR